MQTQAISPDLPLPPGAFAALGGVPLPMPGAPAAPAAISNSKSEISNPAEPAEPEFVTGHPTFDDVPPALLGRRHLVADLRLGLRRLIAAVSRSHDTLAPLLDSLRPDADAVLNSEGFDVTAAAKLLADLHAPIRALTEPPARISNLKSQISNPK